MTRLIRWRRSFTILAVTRARTAQRASLVPVGVILETSVPTSTQPKPPGPPRSMVTAARTALDTRRSTITALRVQSLQLSHKGPPWCMRVRRLSQVLSAILRDFEVQRKIDANMSQNVTTLLLLASALRFKTYPSWSRVHLCVAPSLLHSRLALLSPFCTALPAFMQ